MAKKRRSRKKGTLPKGAYRLPTGGYLVSGKPGKTRNGRAVSVKAVHRDAPDYKSLARVFLELAIRVSQSDVPTKSKKY